ncbi:unnamed protein product, partial [Staurois parvus]
MRSPQSLGHPLYCLQSLVNCTMSAVPGIFPVLYYVHSLWSSVLCPQTLVISCTMSAVSGHPLYCSLWSSPVLSAVSGHPL